MGLTFNGISLASAIKNAYIVNAFVEHPSDFVLAEPDVSITHVPGRNGDIVYDDGSYKNVLIKYEIAVRGAVETLGSKFTNFQSTVRGLLSTWLYPATKSATGYYTLRDDYDTGHYRLARPYGQVQLENIYGWNARGTITFDCRPERYFSTIPPTRMLSNADTIDNTSYNFPAKPILQTRIIGGGTGAFAIYKTGGNMYRVQLDNVPDDTITLDCDTQEATFSDGTSANSYITLTGVGTFPVLEPGIVQTFATTGQLSTVLLVNPRRWEI